jgi:hypothetical protein
VLATTPVDLGAAHDGLVTLVQSLWKADPYSGTLFVFLGRRMDRVKILFFSAGGFVLYFGLKFEVPALRPLRRRLDLRGAMGFGFLLASLAELTDRLLELRKSLRDRGARGNRRRSSDFVHEAVPGPVIVANAPEPRRRTPGVFPMNSLSFARLLVLASSVATLGLVGCAAEPASTGDDTEAVSVTEAGETALPAFRCDGSTVESHDHSGDGGSLHAIRTSAHPAEGFDRFVMEFEPGVNPNAYIVAPQKGTSFFGTGEDETTVRGVDGIAVIFMNSMMESSYTGPRRVSVANGKGMLEVAQYDQFEANDEWGIGTPKNACFRAFTLQSPPRLIVDVKR